MGATSAKWLSSDALAAAKARGVLLGKAGPANLSKVNDRKHAYAQAHAQTVRATLYGLHKQGLSQREIASELNRLGIKAP
jgi:hypothetical protein